jgi:hypothetical protein
MQEKKPQQPHQNKQQQQVQQQDTLKHIVDRVIAAEDISTDLLEIREAAEEEEMMVGPRFQVRLGVDNTNLEKEGLGIHINITTRQFVASCNDLRLFFNT